ncbi:hypothetical protein LK10_12500 [Sinomonas humi]|uniref:Uncharacterized protein n=1 Tax=Sinomonas humi TaxID=1338436 RepID=A0A0B2AFX7_9MICC|nr:hypothetical protein LK10_12500 [Sinomonas humi]
MATNLVDALVDDIRDLLRTSAVGLYEFIWLLQARDASLSLEAKREQASLALERLLADGQGRLALLMWPSEDVVETYPTTCVGPHSWEDPVLAEPYIAITRN